MPFPYHQINDDIEPAPDRHIQNDVSHHTALQLTKPLLDSWPLGAGLIEILIGFIAAGLGAVEVFVIPLQIDVYGSWTLYPYNFYGSVLWSAILLILTGSCTLRAATFRSLTAVRRFYLMSLFSSIANLAFIILILVCYTKYWPSLPVDAQPYSVIPLLGALTCILGWVPLVLSVVTHTRTVLFGDVHLLRSWRECCYPCCQMKPSHASSIDSIDSNQSNMII